MRLTIAEIGTGKHSESCLLIMNFRWSVKDREVVCVCKMQGQSKKMCSYPRRKGYGVPNF